MGAVSGDEIIPEEGFSLAKISFGDILSPLGTFLMIFGFGAYFQLLPGSSISGVALIYGFPMLLLGFALKYAQLDPVTCTTSRGAYELRETQMTDNQKRVREDCTRYRYSHATHLTHMSLYNFRMHALYTLSPVGFPGGYVLLTL